MIFVLNRNNSLGKRENLVKTEIHGKRTDIFVIILKFEEVRTIFILMLWNSRRNNGQKVLFKGVTQSG